MGSETPGKKSVLAVVWMLNLVVMLLIAVVVGYALLGSRTCDFSSVELPFDVPDEYLLSHRVYQEFNTETEGYDIEVADSLLKRTFGSCWEYRQQPDTYESSENSTLIWGTGTNVEGGSGAMEIYCDTDLEELNSIVIGGRKLLDLLFLEEDQVDVGMRSMMFTDLSTGDTFHALTRAIAQSSEYERQLLFADVPLSIRQKEVRLLDNSNIWGPLKWTIPVAFWIDEGAFLDYSVDDWQNQEYVYAFECLDDTCSYVKPVLE